MKEQRQWQRLPLGIPIVIQGITEQKTPLTEFGTTTNIGAGGLLLATRMPLVVGRRILLQIPAGFPEQQPPVRTHRKFRAKVLRVLRQDHWYLCAAAFSTPLPTGTSSGVSRSAHPSASDPP
jgi:PilZ domain-containing protein